MQRNRARLPFAVLLSTIVIGAASAQPPAGPQGPSTPAPPVPQPIYIVPAPQGFAPPARSVVSELPMVELAPLLQRVERGSNRRFLVDGAVGPRVFLAGVEANDVDYSLLLSILRANGLAAVEIDGRINIVRDAEVRFLPAQMTEADDADIAADEWVTRVITTTNIDAAPLVPILRPLLPQAAHLAAHATSNRLIVMDRYANVQRIAAIVRALDVPAPRPGPR